MKGRYSVEIYQTNVLSKNLFPTPLPVKLKRSFSRNSVWRGEGGGFGKRSTGTVRIRGRR